METASFREALEATARSGLLVLTGPPGSGKSCMGHALLRHYQAQGYTPLVLHR